MSSRMRLLSSETWCNAINIPQTRQRRFKVQLATLSQVRVLSIIVESKQGTPSLDLRLHHTWRSDFCNMVFHVYLTECGRDSCTDFEDVGGDGVADDEMALVI